VGDELVAGVAELVGVTIAGEVEGPFYCGPVDRQAGRHDGATGPFSDGGVAVLARGRVELLDDREEVGEKLTVR
jgi:hypothetical protein